MKSDVRTTFCPNFDFTVKALMISNSLYHRNFQTKTDMKVKICLYAKLCTQSKILALWRRGVILSHCSQNSQAEWVRAPVEPHHLSVMTRGRGLD